MLELCSADMYLSNYKWVDAETKATNHAILITVLLFQPFVKQVCVVTVQNVDTQDERI